MFFTNIPSFLCPFFVPVFFFYYALLPLPAFF